MRRGSDIGGASLNALRSFEAAARHLSFVAAAEELGVTASAISIQIKRLETRIGRPLFVRSHRQVRLSPAGARLAPRLGAIFIELDRVLAEEMGPVLDTIQISAMPSFAAKWLAPRLPDFTRANAKYPVRMAGADQLVDFDRDGVDIGLRYGPGGAMSLHEERLAEATAFPVCSPAFLAAHRAALSQPSGLLGLPLLQDETALRSSDLPDWSLWLARAGVAAPAHIHGPVFESLHMALSAAVAGQGVAMGLTPLINEDLRTGALIKPFDLTLSSSYSFWFVCRKDRLRERKIRAFRDWIFSAMTASAQ